VFLIAIRASKVHNGKEGKSEANWRLKQAWYLAEQTGLFACNFFWGGERNLPLLKSYTK
jgi:hypothetical protein